jgi:hypothetical protein
MKQGKEMFLRKQLFHKSFEIQMSPNLSVRGMHAVGMTQIETAQAVGPSLQYYGEASPRKAHTRPQTAKTPKTKIAFSNFLSSSFIPIPIPLRAPTNAFEIQILKP